jgi:hypothetical protein
MTLGCAPLTPDPQQRGAAHRVGHDPHRLAQHLGVVEHLGKLRVALSQLQEMEG